MNDRAVSLLEQYDVEIQRTRKGRGAILCETPIGILSFREYSGSEERLVTQNKLLSHLQETSNIQVERMIPCKSGDLSVKDMDGTMYVLRTFMEGRECNIADWSECMESAGLLARLHLAMEVDLQAFAPEVHAASYSGVYDKYNRELRRVRKYLKQRSQKTWFEIRLLQVYDEFLEEAESVSGKWEAYEQICRKWSPEQKIIFAHGDYQYHNLIRTDRGFFVMGFDKCVPGDPVRDIYLLFRKLLEKNNWNIELGRALLAAYEEKRGLSAFERIDLYYRLSYPEKFRKIVNFYYNSGKSWIPGRNLEKLEKVIEQEPLKRRLLEELFCTL